MASTVSKKPPLSTHKSGNVRTPRGGIKPVEEHDDLAAFFKRKKEGADPKGPSARPALHHKSVKF